MAQTKFLESKKSIENTEKYSIGQPLLVPLTGSVSFFLGVLGIKKV